MEKGRRPNPYTYEEAVEAFAEQIRGLEEGGAEIAWIETMSAPAEARAGRDRGHLLMRLLRVPAAPGP